MEYQSTLRLNEISFEISSIDPDVLDKVCFTYLIAAKFSGEIQKQAHFVQNNTKIIYIKVKFKDYENHASATSYCKKSIKNNSIKTDQIGVLNHIDPKRNISQKIKNSAEKELLN